MLTALDSVFLWAVRELGSILLEPLYVESLHHCSLVYTQRHTEFPGANCLIFQCFCVFIWSRNGHDASCPALFWGDSVSIPGWGSQWALNCSGHHCLLSLTALVVTCHDISCALVYLFVHFLPSKGNCWPFHWDSLDTGKILSQCLTRSAQSRNSINAWNSKWKWVHTRVHAFSHSPFFPPHIN